MRAVVPRPAPHALAPGPCVTRGVRESPVVAAAVPGTAYLAAEEMAEHAAAPQVPDDDEAPAVADEDLVGVSRVFLQSLHHLEHPPLAGLLRQPGRGERREPAPTSTHRPRPTARLHAALHVAVGSERGGRESARGHIAKGRGR